MRIRIVAVAALVMMPMVSACSDGEDKDTSPAAKTFCGVVVPVQALAGISDKADDSAAIKTAFTAAESALAVAGSAPPADLKPDLDAVTSSFTAANTALKASEYNYSKAAAANSKALEALDSPAFIKATDNIQAWAAKNCDGFAK